MATSRGYASLSPGVIPGSVEPLRNDSIASRLYERANFCIPLNTSLKYNEEYLFIRNQKLTYYLYPALSFKSASLGLALAGMPSNFLVLSESGKMFLFILL